MTKEEFLSMSLPYGLKLNETLDDLVYVVKDHSVDWTVNEVLECGIKPILRPLSELSKTIDIIGDKFIPIIELAKIANFFYDNDNLKVDYDRMSWVCYTDKKNVFGYFNYNNCFFSVSSGKNRPVPNQLKMFQKLIEWHFDIAGLIDKNEAIDYSTLEGFSF